MKLSARRTTRIRRWLFLTAILLGITVGTVYIRVIRPQQDFRSHVDEIHAMLQSVETRPPNDVTKKEWQRLCQTVEIGVANAIFSVDWVPVDEVAKLKDELHARIGVSGPVETKTIVWFWDRMGQCSQQSLEYISRSRPLLQDVIPTETTALP